MNNYTKHTLPQNAIAMQTIIETFGLDNFKLNQVWHDTVNGCIMARFKHDVLGFISGLVVVDFEVKHNMEIVDIYNNLNYVSIRQSAAANALGSSIGVEFE